MLPRPPVLRFNQPLNTRPVPHNLTRRALSPHHTAHRLTFLFLLCACATALGQVTLSPTAVVDSNFGEYNVDTPYVNMINQSGVDTSFTSGVTDFNTYFATPSLTWANANYQNNWQSQLSSSTPLSGYLDFDLGGTYVLDQMAIWNISLENVTVTVFDELTNPGQLVGSFTLTDHQSFPFSYPVDVLDFGGDFTGRYVRLGVDSTYIVPPPNDFITYAIVGEVVLSATVIPEPGAMALLATGLLALGAIGYRSRRRTAGPTLPPN
jgi:hypothetical protein